MSARARLQLVQVSAVQGVGLVRVTWSPTWRCYLVTSTRPGRGVVSEFQTPDRARALDMADQALADLADLAGMPA